MSQVRAWLNHLRRSRLLAVLLVSGIGGLLLTAPSFWGAPSLPFAGLFRFVFYVSGIIYLWRWLSRSFRRFTWSLRNRLVAAYIFVAVVPVLLIATMVGLALWLFYGQYAADLLAEDIRDHVSAVQAVSSATAMALARTGRPLSDTERAAENPSATASERALKTYTYQDGRSAMSGAPELPAWLKPGFAGMVLRPGAASLAAYTTVRSGGRAVTVLAMLPITPPVVDELTQRVGTVQAFGTPPRPGAGPPAGRRPPRRSSEQLEIVPAVLLQGSRALPPAASFLDWAFTFPAFVPFTDWESGNRGLTYLSVTSRRSILDEQLFNTRDQAEIARWPLWFLSGVAIAFLVIELASLITGIRLTRTITRAANDLYEGTQRINAGDFSHHVPVRAKDQLAALAESFNSMTDSITRLLAEQRQKHRLESELSIAHEVQTQLFPRYIPRVRGVELSGTCIPARVVSGDYYDFIELGDNRLGFAVGDISGKGISAALLMATIASAIRAYQHAEALPAAIAAGSERYLLATDSEPVTPSLLVSRLNEQLYRSTTQEKYATLLYGVYDGNRRQFRYTNAGHLPPAVLSRHGRRRLTSGGMVIGLFDTATYDESAVTVEPGDIIVAWSDGLTEPENDYGEEFGEERLLSLIETHRDRPLEFITQTVLAEVREWNGNREQQDDMTLVFARML